MKQAARFLRQAIGQSVGAKLAGLAGYILLVGSTTIWAGPTERVTAIPALMPKVRAELGKVAVVSSASSVEFRFQTASGQARSPADAAEEAVHEILNVKLPSECTVLAPLELPVAGVAALIESIRERGRRVSSSNLRALEEALSRAGTELASPDRLREQVLRTVNERLRTTMRVPAGASEIMSEPREYSTFSRMSVDTLLQLELRTLRLERLGSGDRSYAVQLEANVKLVHTRDAKVLYSEPIHYCSGTSLFIDWALNDAEAFKAQVQRGYALMAEQIVAQLFLQTERSFSPGEQKSNASHSSARTGHTTAFKRSSKAGIVQVVAPVLTPTALSHLGRVGIMATSTIPKLSVQRPLSKGRAVEEALGNAQSQVDEWAQAGTLGEQIGLVSAIPVSLAEQTIGAIQGLTEKKLRTSDDAITRAVQDARPQESIRQRVLEDAQLRTRHPVALVPKPFPPGLEKECSSMSCFMAGTLSWVPDGQTCDEYLRSRGFESVLEIELLYPAFKQASRRFALSPDANPPLELHMDVRATLRRTGESDALYSFSFAYRGAARKFTAWAAHDAQPLREELEHCYATVAAKIVEQLAVHAWTEDLPMELARTSSLDSRQPVEGK